MQKQIELFFSVVLLFGVIIVFFFTCGPRKEPQFKDVSEGDTTVSTIKLPTLQPIQLGVSTWIPEESPTRNAIEAIDMVSSEEGWAVGESGIILQYYKGHWKVDDNVTDNDLRDIDMISAEEGWAVGVGVILHFDGAAWHTVDVPSSNSIIDNDIIDAVGMVASDKGWAMTKNAILKYDGKNWSIADENRSGKRLDVTDLEMLCVTNKFDTLSSTDLWCIVTESNTVRPYLTPYYYIYHNDGHKWFEVFKDKKNLTAIDMVPSEEGWVVGYDGLILHYANGKWLSQLSRTDKHLYDLCMISTIEGWAVGEGGTILHYQVLNEPLERPNVPILSNIDNQGGKGNYILNWKSVDRAIYYIVEEADKSMYPNTIYAGSDTSKKVSGKDIGRYYYRISAVGYGGKSDWSKIKSVRVTTPPTTSELKCTGSWNGRAPSLSIIITCESGEYTTSMDSWQTWDEKKGRVTHFEGTRIYKDSGNEYKIIASAYPDTSGKDGMITVAYNVEVTGGAFGTTTKICSSN